jgi:hypothetical protein
MWPSSCLRVTPFRVTSEPLPRSLFHLRVADLASQFWLPRPWDEEWWMASLYTRGRMWKPFQVRPG